MHCGRRGFALKAAACTVAASPAEAPLHKNWHVNEGLAPDGQETQAELATFILHHIALHFLR